jgi:hypothetical protein
MTGSPAERTTSDVLEAARALFGKEGFDCETLPTLAEAEAADSVGGLWLDYICERGPETRHFTAEHRLTHELAHTDALHEVRRSFYDSGWDELTGRYMFNLGEFVSATGDMIVKARAVTPPAGANGEFSITHFLGSFEYRVTRDGDRLRIWVRNVTDRASGTRIPLRFPDAAHPLSLEELLTQKPELTRRPFLEVLAIPEFGLVSLLQSKTRAETRDDLGEGGGVLVQTFEWTERYMPGATRAPLIVYEGRLDIR